MQEKEGMVLSILWTSDIEIQNIQVFINFIDGTLIS